jgi:hypothetical protein
LHFQRIPLDDVGNPLHGLLSPKSIKFDAITKHVSTVGYSLERHTIANTRIDCGRWSPWEVEESADSLGFGQWQWVETESTFALEAQGRAPFSDKLARLLLRLRDVSTRPVS